MRIDLPTTSDPAIVFADPEIVSSKFRHGAWRKAGFSKPSVSQFQTETLPAFRSQRRAIKRVPDAMVFDHRDHNSEMSIIVPWKTADDDVANIQWGPGDLWTAAQPFPPSAVYANHMTADEAPERVRSAYGSTKFARRAQLKSQYDPTNLFATTTISRPLAADSVSTVKRRLRQTGSLAASRTR